MLIYYHMQMIQQYRVYMSYSNMDDLFLQANEDIDKISNCFCANKLSLYANKTKYNILRSPSKPCHAGNHKVCMNDIPLSKITTITRNMPSNLWVDIYIYK